MGFEGEWAFDTWSEVKGIHSVQWGMNVPPFSYFKYLPREIRWQPDRLVEDTSGYIKRNYHANLQKHFFVEVKGCGVQQVVKIKKEPLRLLTRVQRFFKRPILFFINDSHKKRISISHSLDDIVRLAPEMEEYRFHEGTEAYLFPTDVFLWELWNPPPMPLRTVKGNKRDDRYAETDGGSRLR